MRYISTTARKIRDCEQSKDKIAPFFAILTETRDLSRGDLGGRCTPYLEMTYGFLIQVIFCRKENYEVYWS